MQDRFESFMRGVTSIYRSVQRIKNMEMSGIGLKGMHVMCLFFLYKHPEGLTAGQLCEKCDEDKAAISRSVQTLKEKNYIAPARPDRAKKYKTAYVLTPDGRAVAEREAGMIINAVSAGGEGLDEGTRKAFYGSLSHIADNLENYVTMLKGNNE